jgi:hypothetical protein
VSRRRGEQDEAAAVENGLAATSALRRRLLETCSRYYPDYRVWTSDNRRRAGRAVDGGDNGALPGLPTREKTTSTREHGSAVGLGPWAVHVACKSRDGGVSHR